MPTERRPPYARAVFLVFTVVPFVLSLAALVDIVPRDDSRVQHLPKLVWVLLVVLLPVLGSVLWFAVGREHEARVGRAPRPWATEQGRPHMSAAHVIDRRVRSTEQQLADLEAEEEHFARLARLRALEAEVEARRDASA